jgi:hypothetical protein
MAKKAKKKTGSAGRLQTLPLDLSRLAAEPIEAVQARASDAVRAAVQVFDTSSASAFVFSGKDAAPMGSRIELSDKGVKIRVAVSSKPESLRFLDVRPGLSPDTTGARRAEVSVMASRARGFVSVPNGFVWDERIFMRQGNKRTKTGKSVFVNAKKFLIKAGADPSPSVLLGAAKDQVLDALTASILEGIENAGKDR